MWIFTAVLSIGCAVAFGLAPALRAVAAGQTSGITINQRVSTYAAMKGMRPLVAAQLALSFAVVFAAGTSRAHAVCTSPASIPDSTRIVSSPRRSIRTPAGTRVSRSRSWSIALVAAIDAVPGVVSTSVTTCSLMTNCSYSSGFTIEGADRGIQLNNNWVSPAYFSTIGIPLVAGRDFTERDTAQSPRVAIISESIARRYFTNQNPLGKRLGYDAPDTEIVGVVRDARPTLHAEPTAMVYFPTRQPPNFTASPHAIAVRVTGDADLTISTIRAAIQRTEPGLLLDNVSTMAAALERDVARERLIAYLASSFAGPRAVARLRRALRRAVVYRRQAHAGDRRPHGTRRAAC